MARLRRSTTAPALAGAALVLALAGCFGGAPEPTATTSPTSAPRPTPTETPPPTFAPELSATENLDFFDHVNQGVVAADPAAGGRAFIDALAAAGFDKAAMQVTADTTTLGEAADSVQFAVAFQGECLVGQYGPKSGGYHGAVRPALGTGGCLIGQTRPIDW
ncbi:hypothetical protein GE115_01925 [Agromyces sp. CFH 90414]|uniref:DUF6993 domain-containing protein n=1 Tax=Agromyces agglutinans TaxID=2662258 RepID=A0A6I2EZR9_9MICO|nr:hypothetical protein [Agromyces agglutinans]MRG58635.1 hypothetical protein [Agromyces agglutinans]